MPLGTIEWVDWKKNTIRLDKIDYECTDGISVRDYKVGMEVDYSGKTEDGKQYYLLSIKPQTPKGIFLGPEIKEEKKNPQEVYIADKDRRISTIASWNTATQIYDLKYKYGIADYQKMNAFEEIKEIASKLRKEWGIE